MSEVNDQSEVQDHIQAQPTPAARRPTPVEDVEGMSTPDFHNVGMKLQRAKQVYEIYAETQEKPASSEVFGWYFYGFCSYFIHTVLVPILFPLIIGQTLHDPPAPPHGWLTSYKGFQCTEKQMRLYQRLTDQSIKIGNAELSSLEWTSVAWVLGLVLAAPILSIFSIHLDHGRDQQLLAGVVTAMGGLFCLPAGFFRTRWIFPPYIAFIIIASTIGTTFHARHMSLMIRGFVGSPIRKSKFPNRRAVSSLLSVYSTAAGGIGSALIAAFIYHMLRKSDKFTSLWVVSIFSGLIWLSGTAQIFVTTRSNEPVSDPSANSPPIYHTFSIFKYPHAAGSLVGLFLSSLTTMCLFTGGLLYSVGELCLEAKHILYLWLIYFIFPLLSLPVSHHFQKLIRADAVKMQLLGFLLSITTSGFGFYFRHRHWQAAYVLFFTAVLGTSTGLLYAFGRVLLLDCSPSGKEGAFSAWFSLVRSLGTWTGFAIASATPGNVQKSFGISFCAALVGVIVLIFGNVDNFRGAKAAGHLIDQNSQQSSPVEGLVYSTEHPHQPKNEV
ncbi:OLC1v1031067C1 [Oldenlandia corymbosa var. corymbosa]|uniref:OLC1v1031067C1 n=1 Tax=Oldenlandia corymbosa var. corymbosa TaxID=529605 RepID=A0AAV1CJI0_OLDCO|nr:OLC1v1031067C1 [Oldenlandia corymbosa var. corymbosa]